MALKNNILRVIQFKIVYVLSVECHTYFKTIMLYFIFQKMFVKYNDILILALCYTYLYTYNLKVFGI